jgi:staphyloferrin A synthase
MTHSPHLAEARTAILARLWCALAREPLPGIAGRRVEGDQLTVEFAGGTTVHGIADAATPFRPAPAGFGLHYGSRYGSQRYQDPAALVRVLPLGPHTNRFAAEVGNSVANLALARAAAPAPDNGPPYLGRCPDLANLEQCIVDGHPLHPLCRTRIGMSRAEVQRYAPEHRPVLRLPVVEVPEDRWLSTGVPMPPLLPVHPWQYEHVLDRYPGLRPTGEIVPARPLMSLRTVAMVAEPGVHLKTSVDIQMTSAVRTVSAAAIHNGPELSRLLRGLCEDTGVEPMCEISGGAVLVDGEPCPSLAILRRHAPHPSRGELLVPVAALSAPSPASGRPLLTELVGDHPREFFTALANCLVPPLLRLLDKGVALEAHGQNTLLVLRDGVPVRLVYRDLGGIRVLPHRLRAAHLDPPTIRGDLRADEPDQLHDKLFAALVSTVLSELVAVFEREYGLDPSKLWYRAWAAGQACLADAPWGRMDARAMFAPAVAAKALTAMRLSDNPIEDIWIRVPNPLAEWRR